MSLQESYDSKEAPVLVMSEHQRPTLAGLITIRAVDASEVLACICFAFCIWLTLGYVSSDAADSS